MRLRTKGVIIRGPRDVSLQEIEVAVDASRDVLVEVELCGLCTPEQRAYRGANRNYPYWGGHELYGRITTAITNGERNLDAGAKVAVGLMERCGRCHYCRAGLDNHCAYVNFAHGTDEAYFGPKGLSSVIAVPMYKLFPLDSEAISPKCAAMIEPIACVNRSIQMALPIHGEIVFVIGAGTMGLLHTVLLSDRGYRVVVFDEGGDNLNKAVRAGAERAVPWTGLIRHHALELTDGVGAAAVFCTRLGAAGIQAGIEMAARGGCVVAFQSLRSDGEIVVSANDLHYRELRVVGTIAHTTADLEAAVAFASGRCKLLDCLTTVTIPASQAAEAFETAIQADINRVHVDFSAVRS
jgi:L-iditol 2-dehydrogenase